MIALKPQHNLFSEIESPLPLGDAVAAFIMDEQGRYLMQARDDKPGIFYPGHWGVFGGGVDAGETKEEAMRRELLEELCFEPERIEPIQELSFDLFGMSGGKYFRHYYETSIRFNNVSKLTLSEGRAMKFFSAPDLLTNELVAPYDSFAIWLHYSAYRGIIRP